MHTFIQIHSPHPPQWRGPPKLGRLASGNPARSPSCPSALMVAALRNRRLLLPLPCGVTRHSKTIINCFETASPLGKAGERTAAGASPRPTVIIPPSSVGDDILGVPPCEETCPNPCPLPPGGSRRGGRSKPLPYRQNPIFVRFPSRAAGAYHEPEGFHITNFAEIPYHARRAISRTHRVPYHGGSPALRSFFTNSISRWEMYRNYSSFILHYSLKNPA